MTGTKKKRIEQHSECAAGMPKVHRGQRVRYSKRCHLINDNGGCHFTNNEAAYRSRGFSLLITVLVPMMNYVPLIYPPEESKQIKEKTQQQLKRLYFSLWPTSG